MLRNYQIVIFKDQHGIYRKLRLHGWLFALLLLILVSVIGANFFLVRYYYSYNAAKRELTSSEKTVVEQKTQLVSLADKLKNLESDLSRIRAFDSKLRLMINLDQEPRTVSNLGSADSKDFTNKYLPLYRQEMLTRKLHQFLRELNADARLEQARQKELLAAFEKKQDFLASIPAIWPTEGWISSGFGERLSPFSGKKEFHKGLDISAPMGAPVYAPADGTVVMAGDADNSGNSVTIDHKGGLTTSYNHLKEFTVDQGQSVAKGDLIGYVGNTGQSTGPHLHYEVRLNGAPVNPMRYILN
jgi:murein DD-endopeptidase MepM/ murein hydrolase activator NlpD